MGPGRLKELHHCPCFTLFLIWQSLWGMFFWLCMMACTKLGACFRSVYTGGSVYKLAFDWLVNKVILNFLHIFMSEYLFHFVSLL